MRFMWPNKALDPTAVSVSVFMRFDFVESLSYRNRAVPSVGQLGRYAKRHACSATVRSRVSVVFGRGRIGPKRAADFVCFAAERPAGGAEFGVGGPSPGAVEYFFRVSLLDLPGPRNESHNQALDRTAMSAVFGVFADSWLAAALMAVGQLFR